MTFDDFLPYVLPEVPLCPTVVAIHHIRLAAIEFCRRTCVWHEVLDPVTADGVKTEYALNLDPQMEIVKLIDVTAGDTRGYGLPTSSDGLSLVRQHTNPGEIAFATNRQELHIHPAPALDASIVVEAILKPSIDATEFPDDIFNHHAEDISHGALKRLLAMPKKDWTDLKSAAVHSQIFEDRIGTAGTAASKGHARSAGRVKAYFY